MTACSIMLPELQTAFRASTLGRDEAVRDALVADGLQNPHRLGIYQNNIYLSLIGVLEAAFPTIRGLVGEENFAVLANRFIAAHPPRAPQLYAYGAEFAGFVDGFEAAVEELPFLPDLARVEWAVNDAYFAANAAPLSPGDLGDIAPEAYGALQLHLHPSAHLIDSPWPVWHLWGAEALPDPWPEEPGQVLVQRPADKVDVLLLTAGDFAFVTALKAGATLAAAAEAAMGADEGFDLQAAFGAHLNRGTFTREFTIASAIE